MTEKDNIININNKLPVRPDILLATKMSGELMKVLNSYINSLPADIFAGTVTDALIKVLQRSDDITILKCLNYLTDALETRFEKSPTSTET